MVSSPQVAVKAASPAAAPKDVELRFTIQQGLHINSHIPHWEFLIRLTLTLTKRLALKLDKSEDPQGVDYHFEFSPKMRSVYIPVVRRCSSTCTLMPVICKRMANCTTSAARGDKACNPPQTLPVQLDVTAREQHPNKQSRHCTPRMQPGREFAGQAFLLPSIPPGRKQHLRRYACGSR